MGVTIKQIALEVGVSWPAVSQILNQRGRFSNDTRERVLAAAAKHGYRPNSSARALRDQSSKLVGVLFRNDAANALTNMSAFESLVGINQRFQTADLGTLLIRAGQLVEGDGAEPRVFRERLVDGVIVAGSMTPPLIERVRKLSQRIIWLDSPVWEETCCLRRDEVAAGRACVDALANLGHRKITFVTRALDILSSDNYFHHSHQFREAGARAAAAERGIELRVINWPEHTPDLEYEALVALLDSGEGVVAGSMPIARRIDHHSASLGRVAGRAFDLVCCDDSCETLSGWPTLCRVKFDRYAMGMAAAEMMLALLANPEAPPASVIMPPDPWRRGCSARGPQPVETH